MPALPLSNEQLAEAAKLKLLFQNWQRERRDAKLPASQEAACESLGFGQSALAQYLNGKIPLNVEAGIKLANLLGVALADFSPTLAGQATKFAEAVIQHTEDMEKVAEQFGARRVTADDDHAPATIPIRMVSFHLQAGVTGFETVENFDDGGKLHVPRQWVEENDLDPQCLLAVKVKGESMVPLMYEGDIAIINVHDRQRVSGGVFAINFNGQAVVKRLKYERREWYLTSENPTYRQEPCRNGECQVVGRVVRFEPRNFRDRL
ncbi:LexA family transcriptional regulator [Janthinobacterium fluminis]|uniref:XRE family transcriptional regulator n=1 Tax=Janthinobacterium fluminis TaxID=2987524 RepID=A0ABT5JVY8_9BURK|nr:XRE family transcriptional regulator [Janthinobacterium fluminis]MDC8756236.1 XRE family transcriptional regulator [Janthinobacterium fluminis]